DLGQRPPSGHARRDDAADSAGGHGARPGGRRRGRAELRPPRQHRPHRYRRGYRHPGHADRRHVSGWHRRGLLEISMKNRLKVLRAERDWTQADLAMALEVSRQTVNAIETGKYDPSLPLAFRMARLLELSIEEIFLYDG